MKILITGGAGFIGSHLADHLIENGHSVVVVDNESTGRRENVPAQAKYFKVDVRCLRELESAFATGVDAVCHIAGHVSLIGSFTDPVHDLRTNVQGTVNVLQLCLRYRVSRLLYASSMTAYGRNGVLPTPEDTPCEPISYYGITKYASERYVHATAERPDLDFGFRVISFRMYNVYGPRQALDNPYQGVLGIFLGNVLRGEPITIFGDGEQTRDFVYISDVVEAWAGALQNPAAYGQIFNLGSGRLSINQLADLVLAAFDRTRSTYKVVYKPARPGEQRHAEADTMKARTVLGWKPRVTFDQGMVNTVRWAARESVGAGVQMR
jgi:UDP-glucose 4-epimerase